MRDKNEEFVNLTLGNVVMDLDTHFTHPRESISCNRVFQLHPIRGRRNQWQLWKGPKRNPLLFVGAFVKR